MIDRRLLVHTAFLALAPIIVAWFGLSTLAAILLVLLLLLWRWVVVLSGWVLPPKTPELVLSSIAISHFVEKVRWSMDRLALDYVEKPAGGALGAFFLGRTVPQLKARTGAVQSTIGNSAEILRYLWGRYEYELGDQAAFLKPTAERVELETRIDRYGTDLQVWVYFHLLEQKALTLHAWGANDPGTPYWQRLVLRVFYPVQSRLIRRSFRISDSSYARAVDRIDGLLGDLETKLADDRASLLGGDDLNFTDIAFAAMSGIWLMPRGFGAGRADGVRLNENDVPADMRRDVERWKEKYPRAIAFVERLYAEERVTRTDQEKTFAVVTSRRRQQELHRHAAG